MSSLTITDIARAIAAVIEDPYGRTEDYDSMPYWKQLRFIVEAKRFLKVVKILKENRE